MWQAGATPHRGARASHHRGLSCCGAQAPDAQAQQSWLTGQAAPRHVGSSQTRARTRVPCIGRRILNHCATREAHSHCFWCLPPVGKVGSVGCVGFLVEGTGACVLVGEAGSCPSGGQDCVWRCILGCLSTYYDFRPPLC